MVKGNTLLILLRFIYIFFFFFVLKSKFRKCVLSNWKKKILGVSVKEFHITFSHMKIMTFTHYQMMMMSGSSDLRVHRSRHFKILCLSYRGLNPHVPFKSNDNIKFAC